MTEEQKRFKILKRTSYEEQIAQESKEATKNTTSFGLIAAITVMMLLLASEQDYGSISRIICAVLGLLESRYAAYRLKNLIQAISRKTMLEGKIDDIDTELEMLENEESIVMKR